MERTLRRGTVSHSPNEGNLIIVYAKPIDSPSQPSSRATLSACIPGESIMEVCVARARVGVKDGTGARKADAKPRLAMKRHTVRMMKASGNV